MGKDGSCNQLMRILAASPPMVATMIEKMAGDIVIGDKALDRVQRPPSPAEAMFIIPIAAQRGQLGRHRSAGVTLAMASI